MSNTTLPTQENHGSAKEKCGAASRAVAQKCKSNAALDAEVQADTGLYDFHEAYRNGRKVPFANDGGTVTSDSGWSDLGDSNVGAFGVEGGFGSDFKILRADLVGAAVGYAVWMEDHSTTMDRKGLSRVKTENLLCDRTQYAAYQECVDPEGQHAISDEFRKQFDDAVQEIASSAAVRESSTDVAECTKAMSAAQEKLKSALDNFINTSSDPDNLNFAIEPVSPRPEVEPGNNCTTFFRKSDAGGSDYDAAALIGNWADSNRADWYMTSAGGSVKGIPEFDSETDNFTLAEPLGTGTTVTKGNYPVGWSAVLSFFASMTQALTAESAMVTEAEAMIVAANPAGAQARTILTNKVVTEDVSTTSPDGTEDASGEYHSLKEAYDSKVHNIFAKGGGLWQQTEAFDWSFSPSTLPNPQTMCEDLNSAATLLKGTSDPTAMKQAAFLTTNLEPICSYISTIADKAKCIFDNLSTIIEEEEKLDEIAKEIADELDLDLSDGPGKDAFEGALEALSEEGLDSDFFNRGKVIFKEQCWLLAYVESIAGYKRYVIDNAIKSSENSFVPGTAHKRIPYQDSNDQYTALKSKPVGELSNHNASLLLDGDPYGFLNQLITPPSLQNMLDARPEEISMLQPRIRLFKVEYDDNGDDAYEYEIPFDSYFKGLEENSAGVKTFLKKGTRGTGVGIKSFNFVYDGSNPFAIKKSISANLKIFANNMDELLRGRTVIGSNRKFGDFRYTDLAMKTGKSMKKGEADYCADLEKENTTYAPLNFRLRANVGWARPKHNSFSSPLSDGVYNALEDSYVTINLTPTVHNFEIDEQGRVIFNINYLAYIDEFFDQSNFNIFANATMNSGEYGGNVLVNTSRQIRSMRIETISRDCGQDERQDRVEKDLDLLKTETTNSLSFLMTSLISRNKVYYVNLPFTQVRKFNMFGPYHEYEKVASQIFNPADGGNSTLLLTSEANNAATQTRIDAAIEQYQKAYTEGDADDRKAFEDNITASLIGSDPNINTLSFFYLSDLVDIVLENIDEELNSLPKQLSELFIGPSKVLDMSKYYVTEQQIQLKKTELARTKKNLEKMRILLGPAELFTKRSQASLSERMSVFVNLGDMPISTKFFLEFLTDKMLASNKSTYTLTTFLNDLLNNLVREFLNNDDCFKFSIKQKTRVNQTAITAYRGVDDDWDPVAAKISIAADKLHPETDEGHLALRRVNRNQLGPPPILDISGPSGSPVGRTEVAKEYNYFVYYAARTQPTELMRGKKYPYSEGVGADRIERPGDRKQGIFHYLLGRDRGLIKNIKLNKTETKGLAETRFMSEGYRGLEQLRVVYDVEIDMYANVNAFPGSYIYIDPRGFAPNMISYDANSEHDLTRLGIGGYYMIIRSEHEFGSGYANTKITAKWVHSIEKAAAAEECRRRVDAGGNGSGQGTNCKYYIDRKKAAAD